MNETFTPNITSFTELLKYPNEYTNGNTYFVILIAVWFVLMMGALPWGFETAVITSSFIVFILGIFLLYLGLLQMWQLLIPFGVLLFVIFWKIWQEAKRD